MKNTIKDQLKPSDDTMQVMVKNCPKDLQRAARHRAVDEGCSVAKIWVRAMQLYLSKY